ncbi:PREDICTED: kelch-like protein diablo [Amphimedon queenslandica]|uniref:BTB domain-containing protein n=1 Tax=Amphimedon queenslandica TaxID=400682 RepID=A0A1X7UJG2_AMPQE|nr:PREDICTED: kelch-like protein diablo [Amphimedon queenslandica]|eukprot:XP_011404909.1 PREDICTED: kelch-like protein diablo [Amphimedon queenslandica]
MASKVTQIPSGSSSASLPGVGRPGTPAITYTDPQQPSLFFTAFNELRQLQRFCDLELSLKGRTITGHKLILASGSPYIMELVHSNDHGYIELTDTKLDPYAVSVLVEFLYTASLCISETNVLELCYASQVFRMGKIQKSCCKFMKKTLSVSNVIPYLFFCHENNYKTVGSKCIEYAANNISLIVKESSFLNMTDDDLTKFIDTLNIRHTRNETIAVQEWSQYNGVERRAMKLDRPGVSQHIPPPQGTTDGHLTAIHTNTHKLITARHGGLDPDELKMKLKLLQQETRATSSNSALHKEIDTNLPNGRDTSNSIITSSSRLIAIGGSTEHSVTDTCEVFNTSTQEWASIAKLPHKKSQSSSVLYNSKIYSIGGYTGQRRRLSVIDVYDTVNNKWTVGPSLAQPLSGTSAVLNKNRIFIIGGYNGAEHLRDVKVLNIDTGQWKHGPSLNVARSYCQAVMLQGSIYAVGGANNDGRLASVEVLSPGATQWTYSSPLNTPRSRPGVGVHGNQLYAIGGYDGINHLATGEVYDATTDQWTPLAGNMRVQRNSPGVTVAHGAIYTAGGHNGTGINKNMEIYEPRAGKWINSVDMTTPRCDFSLVTCTND